jgi:hypothetical protein
MLGAPVAAALGALGGRKSLAQGQEAPAPPAAEAPTPLARLLAKEDGLSGAEREKVRKDVTRLEKSLRTIREFALPNDVPPAGTFRALRSKRD